MQCYVYKGQKKQDHFVYLSKSLDVDAPEDDLPTGILAGFGQLEFVLEFELTPDRALSQADAEHVIADIASQGFYLQVPKKDIKEEEDRMFGS